MEICPNCRNSSAPGNSFCGSCGTELHPGSLIISGPTPIRISERPLDTPQIRALAATVAVSVAALLAEASLVYLQRRVSAMERPSLSLRRKQPTIESQAIVPAKGNNGRVITIVGERVIEEKRWGRPVRRVVERFAWRGEEHNSS